MTPTQLKNFLYSHARNEWLESEGKRVYVRKGVHACISKGLTLRCVDIASIQITPEGMGEFTRWYPAIRQTAIQFGADAVFFESVLNERFAAKLERMGMTCEPGIGYFDLLL